MRDTLVTPANNETPGNVGGDVATRNWPNGHADHSSSSQSPAVRVMFEPPIPVYDESDRDREMRLAAVVAEQIVPRLLHLQRSMAEARKSLELHPGEFEISELARLVVDPEGSQAMQYVLKLRETGLTLDNLYVELLEPTARHLGDLWNEDKLDFLDVSIGLNGLQRLVHVFAGLDQVEPYDQRRRALIVTLPGEQHMLGNSIVQRFFRSAGWHVCSEPIADMDDLIAITAHEWFGIIGFTLATDRNLATLSNFIAAARDHSLNRRVGIIAGGPAFTANDGRAVAAGADGTAANAPAAVMLAKKLLAEGLLLNAR